MRKIAIALFLVAVPLTLPAQLFDTEVWVGRLDMSGSRFAVSNLVNVSNHPGYDNQPAFFPQGDRLVFTTEAGTLDDTGHGMHSVIYDLGTGNSSPLLEAVGFSPTPADDGKGLMLLRDGRVFLHDVHGKELRALTDTKDAGYFSRFDDRTYALFMNDSQRRVVIYDAEKKTLDTMALGATTPLYRVPGKRAVTFVAEEPFPVPEGEAAKSATARKLFLRMLDLKSRVVTTLAGIPFATGGHHVWTSRGTILMASGPAIFEWDPARPADWKQVYRFDEPDLQGITRIALSARGDRIALVSTPRDETIIRDSRERSNRALESHNGAAFVSLVGKNAVITAASGATVRGREEMQKAIEEQWKNKPDLVYVRTPESIEISRSDAAASERGTWAGRAATGGAMEKRGNYMAVWRREMTESGVPSWTIATEVFVALSCEGAGCGK
jgi:hypothetical protein